MTYTQDQLDLMCDAEINAKVAQKLGIESFRVFEGTLIVAYKHPGDNVISIEGVVDYCNRWQDIMPIFTQYRMYLAPQDLSHAYNAGIDYGDCAESFNTNPCRAIAEAYLLMEPADD